VIFIVSSVRLALLAGGNPTSTLFVQNGDIAEARFLKPAVELVSSVEMSDRGLDAIKHAPDLRPEGSSAGIP
jgi:hypothetical protein